MISLLMLTLLMLSGCGFRELSPSSRSYGGSLDVFHGGERQRLVYAGRVSAPEEEVFQLYTTLGMRVLSARREGELLSISPRGEDTHIIFWDEPLQIAALSGDYPISFPLLLTLFKGGSDFADWEIFSKSGTYTLQGVDSGSWELNLNFGRRQLSSAIALHSSGMKIYFNSYNRDGFSEILLDFNHGNALSIFPER